MKTEFTDDQLRIRDDQNFHKGMEHQKTLNAKINKMLRGSNFEENEIIALIEIQNDIAKQRGFNDWSDVVAHASKIKIDALWSIVLRRHLHEVIETLENDVIEELETLIMNHEDDFDRGKAKHIIRQRIDEIKQLKNK